MIEEHNADGGAVWFQTTLIHLHRVVFDDDGGLAAQCMDVVRLRLDL